MVVLDPRALGNVYLMSSETRWVFSTVQ